MRLRNLPSSIEHFAFRNLTKKSLHRPVINTMNALPNLRVVTCDQHSEQHADFSALQKACDTRLVDLRTDHRYLVGNSVVSGRRSLILRAQGADPVIPRHFPRFRSNLDFSSMPDQHLCSESTKLTGWA
jgi:hypothetical protein